MKITTNSIGNYSATFVNRNTMNNVNKVKTTEVTADEKKFFANMYPEKQKEIMSYEFYNAKGKITGITIGSLFDKRG